MDNPNTGSTLRRRNSVSALPRNPSCFLRNHIPDRSNPYVGWFRHSPPINSRCQKAHERRRPCHLVEADYVTTNNDILKRLVYGGCGRGRDDRPLCHYQSFTPSSILTEYLRREFEALLASIPVPDRNGLLSVKDLLSGHLAGGGKDHFAMYHGTHAPPRHQQQLKIQSLSRRLQKCMDSSSAPVKVLSRIAWWVLVFPFIDDTADPYNNRDSDVFLSSSSGKLRGDDYDSSICTSYQGDDNEDDSTICSGASYSPDGPSSMPLDETISSQAEAYYAHTTTTSLTSTTKTRYLHTGTDEIPDSRLDYDITQMDIVRMTRNASRHLDVESILTLPTITYRAPTPLAATATTNKSKEVPPQPSPRNPEEWSWMLVQSQGTAPSDSTLRGGANHNHTVERQGDRVSELEVCVICLEHFADGDRLRLLPCNHSFHIGCIDQWLSGSHSFDDCYTSGCPTCKKRAVSGGGGDVEQIFQADGSVPSWAFARLGDALARESRHFQ